MAADAREPDLRPWDQALATRVQPLFSALFHDLATPLTIVDSNLYLAERYAAKLIESSGLDEEAETRLRSMLEVIGIARAAAKRVTAGLQLSRDEVWRTVLEGTPLDVVQVRDALRAATITPASEA